MIQSVSCVVAAEPTVRGCLPGDSIIDGCTKLSENGVLTYHSCKCISNYCNNHVLAVGITLLPYSKLTWLTTISLIAIILRA